MSADSSAVIVNEVSKEFLLPHEKNTTIKSWFTSLLSSSDPVGKYERQQALKDISFEVKKGEFFGIVGRNGSGKSTLLKLIAGIYQPTDGSVDVNGRLVPFIELGVGFNPELTGRENIYLNGALLGFSEEEVSEMYDDVVEFAELERFMDQKLKNYSSGMQVRLAFSMAIRADAEILLIDEVLAVGDADFQRKCFNYFKSLKKNNKTVVFVSHDMSAVREYCDRALLVDNSLKVMIDTPETVAEEYIRLFNPSQETSKTAKNKSSSKSKTKPKRWGDKKAMFQDDVVVKVADNGKVEINCSAKAQQRLEKPVFGVMVKDATGSAVCGTNSQIIGIKTGDLTPGEVRKLSWRLPKILNTGTYTIDLAISHHDQVTQSDWWHDAATFKVTNQQSTPFTVSPDIKLDLE